MSEECGHLINPDRWRERLPKDLFEALEEWMRGQGFDLEHLRWLSGKSGCYVAVVQLVPARNMHRCAILKLLPPELALKESRGVSLAAQHSPADFFHTHMVKTRPEALPESRWWLHLQDTAHPDLGSICQLGELIDDQDFTFYCRTVISTIATQWNDGSDDPRPTRTTVAKFLKDDLTPKLEQLEQSAAEMGIDFRGGEPDICIPGREDALPNPFAVLNSGLGADEEIFVFTGNGHGDLNLGNILVSTEYETFRLIDFGRFSDHMPVSRDPSKMLMSIVERWLPDLADHSRLRSMLAALVVRPHGFHRTAATAGYLELVREIYIAASAWGVRRRVGQEWARQHQLSLSASALRTVARADLSVADRWWFLEVTALALAELLDTDRPQCGPKAPGISRHHLDSWVSSIRGIGGCMG